jgi:hypothetical protein
MMFLQRQTDNVEHHSSPGFAASLETWLNGALHLAASLADHQ